MKTRIGVLLFFLVVIASIAHPGVREEIVWLSTTWGDEASDYQQYLSSYPTGRHVQDARSRHDQRSWEEAIEANTVRAFTRYLEEHPQGANSAEAQGRIEERRWETAQATDSVAAYEEYVENHPQGRHGVEASRRLEGLQWEAARASKTITAVEEYLGKYPEGLFADEARAQIATLRVDDRPFQAALERGTEQALKQFLGNYPGHRRALEATSAIEDVNGRDIVDLVREDKIEVETKGSGIDDLSLRLRRMTRHPITVRIPVGTFFAARAAGTQNMVATSSHTITLRDGEWVDFLVEVACANRPRGIPDSGDTFVIQRSPSQRELQKLMPNLEQANAGMAVRQAAVWIVTDDADYSDLGDLVRRSAFQLYGGTRIIREREAAKAMRICSEAGIDIRRKAIWRDREQILKGLEDDGLREWLQSR